MFDLRGKKAIITGGAQGLGYSIAEVFHRAGVDIAIIDIHDKVEEVARSFDTANAAVYGVKGNLLDIESLHSAFQSALEKLGGKVDILINSAGLIQRKPAFDIALEEWNRTLALNVTASFEMSRLAAGVMKQQKAGKIINMGSILSVLGGFNAAAYSASKGAVLQLTKSLSNEWAEYGIQVNAIAPGYMLTTMNTDLMNDPVRAPQVEARIPAKRWGTPEDVAGVAMFLAAPASDYVTGVLIPVDGGVLGR